MKNLFEEEKIIYKKYKILKLKYVLLLILFFLTIYFNYNFLFFKYVILNNYIYTDTLNQIYEENLKIDSNENKGYVNNFDNLVLSLITNELLKNGNDKYTNLYLPNQYQKQKQINKDIAKNSEIKPINDKIVYLKLTNFSKYSKNLIFDNINILKQYENIIIDLRDNAGGTLFHTYEIADLFLKKDSIICFEERRNFIFNKEIKAKTDNILNYKNINIIQNNYSASASEILITALKENLNNVITFGTNTFGKGIGQTKFLLKNGYAVKATLIKFKTPNGNSIHKKGIAPDVEYTKEDIIKFSVDFIS